MNSPLPQDAASQKQIDFLSSLITKKLDHQGVEMPRWKGYPAATTEQVIAYLNGLLTLNLASLDELTKRDASRAIDQLNA